MRWLDIYIGLVAAVLGFGAVVLWAAGAAWAPLLVLAAIVLGFAAWRATGWQRVLLVGDPGTEAVLRLRESLDAAGFATFACRGPNGRPCPVTQGKRCRVDGRPVAALIVSPVGRIEVPPCREALDVPALCVAEGSADDPSIGPGEGRVGWGRGPTAAVEALEELLEAERPGRRVAV